jgi:hypothetical protein
VPPVVLDEVLNADEVVVLGAAEAVSTDKFERLEFGDLPLFTAAPLAGEGVRPKTGGVAVREGGGVGL